MITNWIERLVARSVPEPSREAIRREVDRRNDEVATFIAARYTRGNVAIQRGDMLFSDDLGQRPRRTPARPNVRIR